jgi:hypothetical protein
MTLSRFEEQEERRQVVENDRRVREQGTTFSRFAQADADINRGRFTVHEQSRVIGSEPLARYPQLPGSSPWAGPDLVPTEPPLGVDINELAPTGELHELKANELKASDLEPTPPSAHSPLAVVMSGKATPSASEFRLPSHSGRKSPLGAEGLSSRTYRRF